MTLAFNFATQLESETCCKCGVIFAMPTDLRRQFLQKGPAKRFYCPNGHEQWYSGETEAQKLQKELDRERQRRQMAENTATAEAKRAERAEKKLTRERKRVGNGVCPCCNRSFINLRRHMSVKHPDHSKE